MKCLIMVAIKYGWSHVNRNLKECTSKNSSPNQIDQISLEDGESGQPS